MWQYFFVQDFMLPEIAAYFAQQGITALIYDTCSFSESDGQLRCELDLIKQVEDYSDALSFLASHAFIDPSRIGFWGISFSGTVAFDAAALDRRSRFVISVGPIVEPSGENPYPVDKLHRVLTKALRDRDSQLKGNPHSMSRQWHRMGPTRWVSVRYWEQKLMNWWSGSRRVG